MDIPDASITRLGRVCQEGLSCEQGARADTYCEDCTTYQCSQCDSLLHATRELKQHTRNSLHTRQQFSFVSSNESMKVYFCELWCSPKQPAVLYCQECHVDMCLECDAKIHQGRHRVGHVRVGIEQKCRDKGGVTTDDGLSDIKCIPLSSFLLVNEQEELMVPDQTEFVKKLGCAAAAKVKVVSIFGNTGDGKSHTLNHTFFEGKEVFSTSAHQSSCTIGIWAAYSHKYNAIFVDSEGLLGVSKNENRRTRLLLKVLAISDVVIYRTRAERLHNDLFTFLGDAAEAYWKYFSPELKAASERCNLNVPLSSLGPSVIIFHETQYTELLGEGAAGNNRPILNPEPKSPPQTGTSKSAIEIRQSFEQTSDQEEHFDESPPRYFTTGEEKELSQRNELQRFDEGGKKSSEVHPMSAEELLRIRFSELGQIPKAFCSVEYVGTRTQTTPTDFSGLCTAVGNLVANSAVRSPRRPEVVFTALQILNDKFSGSIDDIRITTFPDAYFTCPEKCLACGERCELSMNHMKDGVLHKISGARCKYSHTFDNKIYLCKSCFDRGVESVVVPKTSTSGDSGWMGLAKYAWSGYVIECCHCGVIYRSRQHWYGNEEPELEAVKTDNKHVWPQDIPSVGQGSDNAVRRLLDGVGSVAEAVGSVSALPAKTITSWMSDQIAPKYWTPNSRIEVCGECQKAFVSTETKHHCRACGGGFCDKCSSKYMAVPWRGWGNIPVRVCLSCYKNDHKKHTHHRYRTNDEDKTNTKPRKGSGAQPAGKTSSAGAKPDSENVTARYVGEVMQSAIGLVTGAISYPKGVIVESARPDYWVPDVKIKSCHKCKVEFDPTDSKHHCRACGEGFCGKCSSHQRAVPSKGWSNPVRVCDLCVDRTDL